jgi:hypothetical protein
VSAGFAVILPGVHVEGEKKYIVKKGGKFLLNYEFYYALITAGPSDP